MLELRIQVTVIQLARQFRSAFLQAGFKESKNRFLYSRWSVNVKAAFKACCVWCFDCGNVISCILEPDLSD